MSILFLISTLFCAFVLSSGFLTGPPRGLSPYGVIALSFGLTVAVLAANNIWSLVP